MPKPGAIIVLALLALGTAGGCTTGSDAERQKVVYHINDHDERLLRTALSNIRNHLATVCGDLEPTACRNRLDIKVVLHGDGVDLLRRANTDPGLRQKVISLKRQGVEFEVCHNTLKGRHINYRNDLFDVSEKDIVPSGVAELARLQQQGYVYIKP